MCVIAASPAGMPQPTEAALRAMFKRNPHGAGYMYAREGKVTIHKGFTDCADLLRAVRDEGFTAADPVVYHFRIATQARNNLAMTHPFPLTCSLDKCEVLDLTCRIALAHNGIIRLTSTGDPTYSDTALFITRYLGKLIRSIDDAHDPAVLTMLEELTASKWAILTGDGRISTAGDFTDDNGILYSNTLHQTATPPRFYTAGSNSLRCFYDFD